MSSTPPPRPDPHALLAEFDALGRDVADLLQAQDGDPSPLLARRDAILEELRLLTSGLDVRPADARWRAPVAASPRAAAPVAPLADVLDASLAATDDLRDRAAARRDDLRQALLALGRAQRAGMAYGAVGRFYDARGGRR